MGRILGGPYSIVRSDTFFKFGYAQINYDEGSGSRISLLLGKTYFLQEQLNLRVAAGLNYMQTIVDEEKKFNNIAVIESGFVFYF